MRSLLRITSTCRSFTSSVRILKGSPAPKLKPLPELREEDLEETFIRGTGPGGQKINKTSVVAQLKHLPTGLLVKCQATRSQSQNRIIARKMMREKLDNLISGDQSRSAIKKGMVRKKGLSAQKKRNRKYRVKEMSSDGDSDASEQAQVEEEEEEEEAEEMFGKGADKVM